VENTILQHGIDPHAQHDLTLTMRNFSEMLLRARQAPEFSHGQDPKRKSFLLASNRCVAKFGVAKHMYYGV
jgi:hypothetical protein